MDHDHRLADAIIQLAEEAKDLTKEFSHGLRRLGELCQGATKHDLSNTERRIEERLNIMGTQIADFATQVQASFDAVTADLDKISAGITNLDALITQLQNSPGNITPADQALLDKIQAASQALKAKADAIDITPPAPPVPTDQPATPPPS